MSRKIRIFAITGLVIVVLVAIAFHKTLIGWWSLYWGAWAADQYVQRDISELKAAYDPSGLDFLPLDGNANPLVASGEVCRHQKVYRICNGNSYYWLPFGEAQNIGYVVTENANGREIVLKVIRKVQIDGL